MDPVTITAVVTAISSVLNNVISRKRTSRKVDDLHDEIRTNHGRRLGEHVEYLVDAMARVENRQIVAEARLDDIAVRVDALERPRRTKQLVAA